MSDPSSSRRVRAFVLGGLCASPLPSPSSPWLHRDRCPPPRRHLVLGGDLDCPCGPLVRSAARVSAMTATGRPSGRYELPEDNGDRFDWSTKTGRYAWLRDIEDRHLHDRGSPSRSWPGHLVFVEGSGASPRSFFFPGSERGRSSSGISESESSVVMGRNIRGRFVFANMGIDSEWPTVG